MVLRPYFVVQMMSGNLKFKAKFAMISKVPTQTKIDMHVDYLAR